jgi:lysozyme family protein
MIENFPACLAEILRQEGGNDDDPHDPGGRTSRGITQREWDAYCKSTRQNQSDVWRAPASAVEDIYRTSYWDPYCGLLPVGLDLLFFDMSVNQGLHEAVILSQRGLGVTADGHIGPVTKQAVQALETLQARREVIMRVTAARVKFYKSLRTWKYFGRGWMNRVNEIEGMALNMVK